MEEEISVVPKIKGQYARTLYMTKDMILMVVVLLKRAGNKAACRTEW